MADVQPIAPKKGYSIISISLQFNEARRIIVGSLLGDPGDVAELTRQGGEEDVGGRERLTA